MLELLSPAGSLEAVTAAVQSGADAVYMGYGNFNARRNAKNFSQEEFAAAISYCHLRGVKVYLTLNTLLTDREMPEGARLAAEASSLGVDAVLVQDLGVLRAIRQVAPDLPLHASTQMTLHNLEGVRMAHDLGQRADPAGGGRRLVDLIIEHTHTCYAGDRSHRHAWGYGCGACPACELRAAGHAEWVAA